MTLGAGSWAQARSLRIASAHLTARLSRAARCDPTQGKLRYGRCVLPALRSASIAGQTTARLAAVVAVTIPAGRCRGYLLEVQAANAAAVLARASAVRTATCARRQRPDVWGRPLPELTG